MITIYSESINIINHLEKIYENGRHGHVRNVNLQLPMTEL